MKRFALIIFTFFSVVACRQEIIPTVSSEDSEFKAAIEDGTKTTLSGLDIIWDSSDIVYLFQGTYNSGNKTIYRVKENCAGSTSTTLVPSGSAHIENESNLNVAIYGQVANNLSQDGSHLTAYVVLPDNQTYVQDSFGHNTMPMIAVTPIESNTLSFKNVCGVLELKFKGENIKVHSIHVFGNNNEQIAGVATVDMSSTYGYVPEAVFGNSIGEIKKTVSLNCTTPVALNSSSPTCFYITMPPITFTKGITVEIETDNGIITKSTAKSLSIDRNSIKPMAEIDLNSSVPLKPLTFTSSGNNCISIEKSNDHIVAPGVEYRIDEGEWQTYSFGVGINVSNGQTLSFRTSSSSSASYFSNGASTYLFFKNSGLGTLTVSGSIMSLISKSCNGDTIPRSYCFANLFSGLASLTDASELLLPADKLAMYCYYGMFKGCSSLTKAPELPATQFASYDYYMMFMNCSSLIEAPELPATTLSSSSYLSMFENCTSLTSMPELPALTVYANCYNAMFKGCSNLVNISSLPATVIYNGCYNGMFDGCTKLSVVPELPATQLASNCYQRMFANTAITHAPVLVATTLISDCYREMFDGCSNLEYIKAYFTTSPSSSYTKNWVRGVALTGTFVKSPSATWNVIGNNGVPVGWTVETTNEYIDN